MKKLNLITKTSKELDRFDINEDDVIAAARTVMGSMNVMDEGEFYGKAIRLSSCYDYVVGEDSCGATILVPLKKK